RSNCSVMLVLPRPLVDVIWARPGIAVNCCSSGVATDDAMVSGLAPGNCADTWMVGKSTVGRPATGRSSYLPLPNTRMPAISRDVPIGRRMKVSEIFIGRLGIQDRPAAGQRS